ncbi:DUF397 domain-containing protein [Streptomyces althioticus]|uniref:DUF397 domain-containing protein n=1 Tax=Streptomyces althioticus TaxID=83380 RepID=UPI0033CA654A
MRHGSSWQATGRLYQIAPTPPWPDPARAGRTLPRSPSPVSGCRPPHVGAGPHQRRPSSVLAVGVRREGPGRLGRRGAREARGRRPRPRSAAHPSATDVRAALRGGRPAPGAEGNACGEVAAGPACTAVRDSTAPSHGTLTVPAPAFAAFVNALKRPGGPVQRRPAHRAACGQITITRRPLVCPARLSAWAAAASARE